MTTNRKPIASTQSGKVEGSFRNGLYVFKGIPYAAPPTGNLRWMPPQSPPTWTGVRPATNYGAIAPQNLMPAAGPGVPSFADQPQSEDCLFLNVWTPGLDDARRPVMFWIHGGAFIVGCGSESFLDAGRLAQRGDIVLVSINYRLGALGFMNLKEITGSQIPATGNEGMLDQIAALGWVHDNISAFGGNPDNITISGFSAGGMSVGTLLGMPAARGKFHKAMNRSGAANVVSSLENAVRVTERFLEILGVGPKEIGSMRGLTTAQILDAQQKLGVRMREAEYRATPFQPVVDGKALPEIPMAAVKKGSAKNIPVMAGNTIDELKAMTAMDPSVRNLNEEGLNARLRRMLPVEIAHEVTEVYRKALQQRGQPAAPCDILGSISTDMMFRIPTIRLVEAQRDQSAPAYNYLFAYKSPALRGALGAMHGLDNPLLFGSLDAEFTGKGPEVEDLATRIQDSCAAFSRYGDPSCQTAGKWPVYGNDRMTMIFDRRSRLEKAPHEAERQAWDRFDALTTPPL